MTAASQVPPADQLGPSERAVRRVRRPVIIGAWCFVTLGTAHLFVMVGSIAVGPAVATEEALDAMRLAESSLLGIDRNMAAMYYGFSAVMALLAISYGLLNLAVVRLAPALLFSRKLPVINLITAVCSLGVAALAFPLTAIAMLGIAVAAFAWALIVNTSHRRPK